MRKLLPSVLAVCALVSPARPAESDAVALAARIQARHLPFGTLLDPMHASESSDQIVGYTRCGDSALWSGAYLAAESFRYAVTKAPDALESVKRRLEALKGLVDITGDNRLARCMVLASSPFADGIAREEASNRIIYNQPWFWVSNTSRDQIVGAFFGLGVAFDLVDDPAVKQGVSDLVTRLIGYISRHQWSPNDEAESTFRVRPESLHMLVQVARRVNPTLDVSGPLFVLPIDSGVLFDIQSNSSYFKFNLDYMSLYHLVRLQDDSRNRGAYTILRNYTESHQNAFFNLIDRALRGPDAARDAETRSLLDQLLARQRRDLYTDLSSAVAACGSDACRPVPVPLRAPATFLWEVSPFQLRGGGSGVIESSGLDYILPYWMARYYGVVEETAVASAASRSIGVAPGALASLYGDNLARSTAQAMSTPLPVSLGGTTVVLTDSAGAQWTVPLLYASARQINFLVPETVAPGAASLSVSSSGPTQRFPLTVRPNAPALFSMNAAGTGVAAATAVTQIATSQSPTSVFQCASTGCVSAPILLNSDRTVAVSFYGTGLRSRANVTVTIGGVPAQVQYAGPAPGFAGLDQVNVILPSALRGRGESNVVLTVDGQYSNAVTINVR